MFVKPLSAFQNVASENNTNNNTNSYTNNNSLNNSSSTFTPTTTTTIFKTEDVTTATSLSSTTLGPIHHNLSALFPLYLNPIPRTPILPSVESKAAIALFREQSQGPKGLWRFPKLLGEGEEGKPPYSFPCLIGMSIGTAEIGRLCVRQIYSFIEAHFPYYKSAKSGWKNSVRHNLSLSKTFSKLLRSQGEDKDCNGKYMWSISPQHRDSLWEDIIKYQDCSYAVRRGFKLPFTMMNPSTSNISSIKLETSSSIWETPLPPHNLTTLPPHNLTTLPPHNLTTLPPHNLTTLPPTQALELQMQDNELMEQSNPRKRLLSPPMPPAVTTAVRRGLKLPDGMVNPLPSSSLIWKTPLPPTQALELQTQDNELMEQSNPRKRLLSPTIPLETTVNNNNTNNTNTNTTTNNNNNTNNNNTNTTNNTNTNTNFYPVDTVGVDIMDKDDGNHKNSTSNSGENNNKRIRLCRSPIISFGGGGGGGGGDGGSLPKPTTNQNQPHTLSIRPASTSSFTAMDLAFNSANGYLNFNLNITPSPLLSTDETPELPEFAFRINSINNSNNPSTRTSRRASPVNGCSDLIFCYTPTAFVSLLIDDCNPC